MKLDLFEDGVKAEVNAALTEIKSKIASEEQIIAKSKDDANALLIANRALEKNLDEKKIQMSGENGIEAKQKSKTTDLAGLKEQLAATDAALSTATGDQRAELLKIRDKLNSEIATANSELAELQKAHSNLEEEIADLTKTISSNNEKIDQMIAAQSESTTVIANLQKDESTQEADLANADAVFKLLKADLIPYEINNDTPESETNKRWIQRFDAVMNDGPMQAITAGAVQPLPNSQVFLGGWLILSKIQLTERMEVQRLGVVAQSSVSQAHLALYRADNNQLITSTEIFSMPIGSKEVDVKSKVTIEPSNYLVAIEGNSNINISCGAPGLGNLSVSNTFPDLPTTISSFSTTVNSTLNLYIAGAKR